MGDIPNFPTYAQLMGEGRSFIEVKLETSEAIEISDFIGAFASIGSQYDRFMRDEHPDLAADAKIYVKQVRHGSIIAELLRQIPPRRTSARHPEHSIKNTAMIRCWTSSATSNGNQKGFKKCPLGIFHQQASHDSLHKSYLESEFS